MNSPSSNLSEEDMLGSQLARLAKDHILSQLRKHRSVHDSPLIVGLSGPQGSGKTTLTTALKASLERLHRRRLSDPQDTSDPHERLSVAIFSVDDLYLPFDGLQRVARENPENRLLQGRGQPGTHDIALGSHILASLRHINEAGGTSGTVRLPIFDKSQHQGKGDRSAKTIPVEAPLDVVLFEGWCLGFRSLSEEDLSARYKAAIQEPTSSNAPYFVRYSLEELGTINANLSDMEKAWYHYIDAFIQLVPRSPSASVSPLQNVFKWRLQAEHAMKESNGGNGMSDDEVQAFVERYMPGYELFGDQEWDGTEQRTQWEDRTLRVALDASRQVIDVQRR